MDWPDVEVTGGRWSLRALWLLLGLAEDALVEAVFDLLVDVLLFSLLPLLFPPLLLVEDVRAGAEAARLVVLFDLLLADRRENDEAKTSILASCVCFVS